MPAFITSVLDVKIWFIYLFAHSTRLFFFDSLNRKKQMKINHKWFEIWLKTFLMHLSLNGQIRYHVVSPSFFVQKDVTSGVATRRLKDITTLHTSPLPCFYAVFYNECNPLLKCHVCWIYCRFAFSSQFEYSDCSPNREKKRDLATYN